MRTRGRPEAFRLLGLARRAGAVAPGTDATRAAVRKGEARLVLMAGDASGVQLKKIEKAMGDEPIPQVILGDRATLGAAIGKGPITAIAVTDGSLAARIVELAANGLEE